MIFFRIVKAFVIPRVVRGLAETKAEAGVVIVVGEVPNAQELLDMVHKIDKKFPGNVEWDETHKYEMGGNIGRLIVSKGIGEIAHKFVVPGK